MGLLADTKAAANVQRIKCGGSAKFTVSSVTCLVVNMPEAKKNLPKAQFNQVYALYKQLRQCKSKLTLDIDGYYDVASRIVFMFDKLAPYEKYSGMDEMEAMLLIEAIRGMYQENSDVMEVPPYFK